MAKISKRITLP
jgi:predicted nucleic acid-binding protein